MTLILCAMALMNLYSASYQTGLGSFKKQLVWVGVGLALMMSVSFLHYRRLKQYSIHFYALSLLALVFVLFFGKEVAGSKSWISLGSLGTIQPSEFVKIPLILMLARFYDNDYQVESYGFADLIKPALILACPLILVALQPDLGTALMIILISGSIILFVGIKKSSILIILAVLIGLSVPTWHYFLKPYQKDRIRTFIDPSRDPLGAGYNSIQSQIAVGSGKLSGKGFRSGSQTQLRFIPAQQTDFAFSVLAEEWGFMGAVFVLLLYFMIILWILDTSSRGKDKFSMLVCFGIAAMLFWHIIVNVGMVIGLLPITGVPLMVFSYGGSSTLTAMIAVGIVLGIRMRRSPVSGESIKLT